MADQTHRYGLDPERYAEVDDELRRAKAYFERLRDELRDKAASTNKTGHTILVTEGVIGQIQSLRFELKREQEHQEIGEAIRRKLYGRDSGAAGS